MDNKESFNYTYSAKVQEEIKAIRKKYTTTEDREDMMAQLRRLDASVTQKAQAVSIALGIIGALILGFGMSIVMTDFGEFIGLYGIVAAILGIITGIVGMILVCAAYPAYIRITHKERERVAPEIIRLTDELMK